MRLKVPRHGLGLIQVGDQFSIHPDIPDYPPGSRFLQVENDRLTPGGWPRGARFGFIGDPGWPVGTQFKIAEIGYETLTIEMIDPTMALPDGF